MDIAEKSASNFLYLTSNYIMVSFFSFMFWTIIVGKFLLPIEYGKSTTLFQMAILISSITNIGLYIALSKKIPELISKKEEDKIPVLLRFSIKASFLSTTIFVIFLITMFILNFFARILSSLDLLLIIIFVFSLQLSSLFQAYWYGYQNMRRLFFISFCSQAVKIIIVTILLFLGSGYLGVFTALLFQSLVTLLLSFTGVIFKKGTYFDTGSFFKNVSIPAYISSIFQLLISYTPFIFLSFIKGTEETGYFSIAYMITAQISIFPSILATSLFPIISGLQKKDSQEKIINLSLKYSLFFSLFLFVFLNLYSEAIINVFMSEKYIPSAKIISILLISFLIGGVTNIFLTNIYGIGLYKIFRGVSMVQLITYLLSIISLTYFFGYLGTCLSFLITNTTGLIILLFLSRNFIKIDLKVKDIFKLLFASSVIYIVWYLFKVIEISLYFKAILLILTSPLYLLSLKFLKFFTSGDKKIILIVLRKLRVNELLVRKIMLFV
ncbi:MAG: oligosaccharide flippase family protein [Candidatus Aenigmarchaeota archaeon]|nr:oligosaccharide flippase family protein [Candidatus Aenigmarchaeota archaeon]MDW8149636.1 oligosaccharide flippase family protein [Candidatus Aenigmarchaeota archaeon]